MNKDRTQIYMSIMTTMKSVVRGKSINFENSEVQVPLYHFYIFININT